MYCHPGERLCDLCRVTQPERLKRLQILEVSSHRSGRPPWELDHLLSYIHSANTPIVGWRRGEATLLVTGLGLRSCPEVATPPLILLPAHVSSQAQSSEVRAALYSQQARS